MSTAEFQDRRRMASAIRSLRGWAAEEATNWFLAEHPDWQTRYGDRARQFGIEDSGYHLDFLAAAFESGQLQAFGEYGAWAARMLTARGIEPRFLAENFEHIGRALRTRLSRSDADRVDSFLQAGVGRTLQAGVETGPVPAGRMERLSELYTEAAIAGRRQAALNIVLEEVRQGRSVVDLYTEVLQPAMYRIGRLWEENRITVAKEHTATAITQYVIAHLYPLIELSQTSRGKIVITGVQGEFHQVGSNMVADVLEASGWEVKFLGTNTPLSGVLDAVEEHDASILGISATMLFNVPNVIRLADAVRAKAGSRIRIIVGGSAFRAMPALCQEIGADGYALDLRSTIELMNGLTLPGA
jgi:MerR family transcriptional regulator, light-induced transcriptional regulator